MRELFHELIMSAAARDPGSIALVDGERQSSYADLETASRRTAEGLIALGLGKQQRIAIFLPKQLETVVAMLATSRAGCVFVPVNPILKAAQVGHILQDSGATALITSRDRLAALAEVLPECDALESVVVTDPAEDTRAGGNAKRLVAWQELTAAESVPLPRTIDADVAAILYTSGSTGKPKGVVLSHRNLVAGGKSVSAYLENRSSDRILAALPLSFDAGFSQLTTAFCVNASVILHNHFFAGDLVKAADRHRVTGITAVPPLWAQIADQKWPDEARERIRYFANTGGKMPQNLLGKLRALFPNAEPFLMYGLTEAFRSTYLPPAEVDRRPDSIGKAIPNAEILVINSDGQVCKPGEPGELVHRGALVSLGYWNAPELTAQRFRPAPLRDPRIPNVELAVWSGDIVRTDEDGFLYFVGRKDDMIKTSGYRVSPTEIEEVGYDSGLVKEIAAIGVDDERLGQRIVVVAVAVSGGDRDTDGLLKHFKASLPAFMVPAQVEWSDSLPRSPNGKIDRKSIAFELQNDSEPKEAVQ